MAMSVLNVGVAFGVVWTVKLFVGKFISVRRALDDMRDVPGHSIVWIHPFRTAAIVFGPIFPLKGWMGYYFAKFSLYQHYGSTVISSVTFWESIPTYWLSDADAIKAVSTERAAFPKDVEAYEALNIYGENMVGNEGSDWKRHRAISKPAFNEANNAFVWRETTRVVNEWFSEIDEKQAKQQGTTLIDLVTDLTKVTLLVISSAGFGRHASWAEDSKADPPPGHKIAFRPAVTSAIDNLFTKVLTPTYIYDLSERIYIPVLTPMLKETRESFEALRHHMLDVIGGARAWIAGGRQEVVDAALLRNLVEANMTQEGDVDVRRLTDEELLSNTFTFLLAGHETSAHSLSFALTLMALYPDVQHKIFEEVSQVWPNGVPSSANPSAYKETMPKLEYTTAAFNETLRLFAPVARLCKQVRSDTTLKARRFTSKLDGTIRDVEEIKVPVKPGSVVIVDTFGLHMNPIHWGDDVAEYRPERFIDTDTYRWPRDAFIAFSSGPRSCIGQRFAMTESTCILASVVRKYQVLLPEDLLGKSREEQKKQLLKWKPGVTITPLNARVGLKRRE